jgi:hypothetical protein
MWHCSDDAQLVNAAGGRHSQPAQRHRHSGETTAARAAVLNHARRSPQSRPLHLHARPPFPPPHDAPQPRTTPQPQLTAPRSRPRWRRSSKSDSAACVKASHTIELGCSKPYDCTNIDLVLSLDDCSAPTLDAAPPVVLVTAKPARSCGKARPILLASTISAGPGWNPLVQLYSPRVALTIQSTVINGGKARPALSAIGAKSVSLVKTDIKACRVYGISVSGGTSLSVKGGTILENGAEHAPNVIIYFSDAEFGADPGPSAPAPSSALLSLSGVTFKENLAYNIVDVVKRTASSVKVDVKSCEFTNDFYPAGAQFCLLYSFRGDGDSGQALTLDFGGTVIGEGALIEHISADGAARFLGCVLASHSWHDASTLPLPQHRCPGVQPGRVACGIYSPPPGAGSTAEDTKVLGLNKKYAVPYVPRWPRPLLERFLLRPANVLTPAYVV